LCPVADDREVPLEQMCQIVSWSGYNSLPLARILGTASLFVQERRPGILCGGVFENDWEPVLDIVMQSETQEAHPTANPGFFLRLSSNRSPDEYISSAGPQKETIQE
jgi:hypothetical protein